MSARICASSVFWMPCLPVHAFQFVVMRMRIAAASNRTKTGTKRRNFIRRRLLGSGCGSELPATAPSCGGLFPASDDLFPSAIRFTPLRASLFFPYCFFQQGSCRPVTQQRLLVLVIGFGQRRLRLQDIG